MHVLLQVCDLDHGGKAGVGSAAETLSWLQGVRRTTCTALHLLPKKDF